VECFSSQTTISHAYSFSNSKERILLDFNKDTMQIYVNGRCAETYNGRYSGGQYSWGLLLDSSSFGGAVKMERKPPPVEVEVISPLV